MFVAPSCEDIVAELLARRGYETYVPKVPRAYTIRGHHKVMRLPMLSRYVFCKFTHNADGRVIGTPKVQKLLGFNNGAGSIWHLDIQRLRTLEESVVAEPNTSGQRGDCVQVIDGPLAGLHGWLQQNTESGVIVEVPLLKGFVCVQLDRTITKWKKVTSAHWHAIASGSDDTSVL